MEHAIGILCLAFAVLMLIYAGLLYYVKKPEFIPRSMFAKIENPVRYTEQFAKVLAVVALAPLAGGIVGLIFGNGAAAIVTAVGLVAAIWLGTRLMKDVL